MTLKREVVSRIYERELSPEEWARREAAAMADEAAIEEARELIRWFKRRYPDAHSRLRYSRRMKRQWQGESR